MSQAVPRSARPIAIAALAAAVVIACNKPAETSPSGGTTAPVPAPAPAATTPPAPPAPPPPPAPAPAAPAAAAPAQTAFTLAEATEGLPGKGDNLKATIKTTAGDISCKLYADKAPNTVANFVGLARGVRSWKNPKTGAWAKSPAYDKTPFHRVIRGFMIQGGDPTGTGSGEPGYTFADEIWPGTTHGKPGLLCMANRGPNTNGMQFFITDDFKSAGAKSTDFLDRANTYTVFGECAPVATVTKIASGKTRGDKALEPVVIETIKITR